MSFKIDDYVDVAERITKFYEKFPDGRLTRVGEPKVQEVGSKLFVIYTAKAYRTADDPVPAIGTAWEPFPGPTQFTRDSELMNAETAAWGRAIIAVGIGSKKIASRQEVEARTSPAAPVERDVKHVERTDVPAPDPWFEQVKPLLKGVPSTGLKAAVTAAGGEVPERVSSWQRVICALDAAGRESFVKALSALAEDPWSTEDELPVDGPPDAEEEHDGSVEMALDLDAARAEA